MAMSAEELRADKIQEAMHKMQRLSLLRSLGLDFSSLVKDVEKLHPLSLFSKTARKIADFQVPFIGVDINQEHCAGATLSRCGQRS